MSKNNVEAIYPLSPMQEGLLFHTIEAPASGAYFEQLVLSLHGSFDIPAFKQAWQQLIAHHTILRTLFMWKRRDKPLQVVRQQVALPWTQHDWRDIPAGEQRQQLENLLLADRRRGFDLTQAPLLRLTLVQLGLENYQFVWSFHHLLLDGWSTSLALQEVFRHYEALHRGEQTFLKRSRPYRDYILWLQQHDVSKAETFWRQALKGFSQPTPLQVNRIHPGQLNPEQEYAEQQRYLPTTTTTTLQMLARQQQVTVNTLVQAAWALLLSRYSGETDVVFGATVAGRPAELAGVEEMIGLFINTLPVRVQVQPDLSLVTWLKELQAQQAEARHYEYTPLAQIQRWSEVRPGQPLFETLLVFENYPVNDSAWAEEGSIAVQDVRFLEKTNYPLTLMIAPGPKLWLQISYNTHYLTSETVSRMLDHLQTLLEAMIAQPAVRLSELPLLTEAERRQILIAWNETELDLPDIHAFQYFEQQVEQRPDAVAVVFEDQQLSYRELNERANQLAYYLRRLGVGPEVTVGLYVKRSLEMMIGLYGVLKAGGAYLPLDPTYPQERLAFMLADSQTPVLLTQTHLVAALPEHRAKVICLDADWPQIAQESSQNVPSVINDETLAYMIYTSGSTGRPKGVQIPHRAFTNFLQAIHRKLKLTDQDTLLAVTTLSFDIAGLELFLPLMVGAKVVLVNRNIAGDGIQLQRYLAGSGATVMQATPATWQLLLAAGWQNAERVKLLCGGEALSQDLARRLLAGASCLWNLYGPTETTIWSTTDQVMQADWPISIGRPIDNTQIYLLDSRLQPVPVGVPGELYIGGLGLARGYLNRPDLTAEKFIPNPFSQKAGAQLYRTGDLARYLPDGRLEFLGRIDHQVKVRGYRIELGEIETVLRQRPEIKEAVVVAREDIRQDKRLVAYFVVGANSSPSINELRAFLAQKLPEYMIPSAFVRLEAIPLTPNGKVNRRALPAPDLARPGLAKGYVAPRNDIEGLLVHIWTDVLGLERVGIYDDFFELGGHSLLATQLIFRLREAFQVELPLRYLFEKANIAGLAEALTTARQVGPETATTTLDLNAEAILDPTIRPERLLSGSVAAPEHILLTGATGFLGVFLLYELLQQSKAAIYCLIRAADLETGRRRIQKQLAAYSLWRPGFSSRITPVLGDLSQPYLGLLPDQFQHLAGQIDLIYHNGALINFVYPYYKLKPANVLGTQEILRLATQAKAIPVHYISTTSVFDSLSYFNDNKRVIFEHEQPQYSQGLLTGYAQSKWVAEKLMAAARERGLPVVIYRPGVIIGDSRSGIWNTDDFTCRFIKGCIQLGYTHDLDELLQLTPVDFVSKAIVYLSKQAGSPGQSFHILNPQRLHQRQIDDWLRAAGYKLEQLPYRQWREKLLEVAGRSPDHALYPLLPLFIEQVPGTAGLTVPEIFTQDREPNFDCQNLLTGLAGSGIVCPPLEAELFNTYLAYFTRSGYLPTPQPVA
jgi:amino acid adenylation domain-containing protein/thioester reductase-like protein